MKETPSNITYHTPGRDHEELLSEPSDPKHSVKSTRTATPENFFCTSSKLPLEAIAAPVESTILTDFFSTPEHSLNRKSGCGKLNGFDLDISSTDLTRPIHELDQAELPRTIAVTAHIPDGILPAVEPRSSSLTEEPFISLTSSVNSPGVQHIEATSLVDLSSDKVIFLGNHPLFRKLLQGVDNPECVKLDFDFSPLSVEEIREVPWESFQGTPANERDLSSMGHIISRLPRNSTLSYVLATLVRLSETFVSKDGPSRDIVYRVLHNLYTAYRCRGLWEEAILVLRLQLMGYGAEWCPFSKLRARRSWKLRILRCVLGLARLFEKKGDQQRAESHYRGASKGLKRRWPNSEMYFGCQLEFARFLLRLDRDNEALTILIRLFIQKASTWSGPSEHTEELFELLEEVFLKIVPDDDGGGLEATFSTLWKSSIHWRNSSWSNFSVFTDFAEKLSILGEFKNAEPLFKFTTSNARDFEESFVSKWERQMFPLRVLQVHIKFVEHYQRQGKWLESAFQLEKAFDCAWHITLGPDKQSPNIIMDCRELDYLLKETRERSSPEDQTKSVLEALRGAESARVRFQQSVDSQPQSWPGLQEDFGNLNIYDNDDAASTTWTMSTKSNKYGVTYSVSDITGISDSPFMVP